MERPQTVVKYKRRQSQMKEQSANQKEITKSMTFI